MGRDQRLLLNGYELEVSLNIHARSVRSIGDPVIVAAGRDDVAERFAGIQ
jgi:hypothetical protein